MADTNVETAASAVHSEFATSVSRISENSDLSSEARDRLLGEAHATAVEKMDGLKADYYAAIDKQTKDLRRRVFSPIPHRTTDTDKAAYAINFRDALERAERVDDSRTATEMLERAIDTEDRVLAKAILHVALSKGLSDALDAYLTAFPEEAEAVSELRSLEARRDNPSVQFQESFLFTPPDDPREHRIPAHMRG